MPRIGGSAYRGRRDRVPTPECDEDGPHRVHREATAPLNGPLTSLPMPRAEATGDSRRRVNWEVRRQAIVDTSARVFARGGYHATGITELCVANDLGKGALYHYIGSK